MHPPVVGARHRQAVKKALEQAVAEQLPRIATEIHAIADGLLTDELIDAANHLAYPVAVAVVDAVVGLAGPAATGTGRRSPEPSTPTGEAGCCAGLTRRW